MHARASGSSELKSRVPVVLVHGLVVSSRYMVPTAERLATHHPVFAPDLPGFGRSENPTRVLDVSGLSDALSAWMGGVGLERAMLIGNSFGCQIIADLAVRHPEHIERAILQGPTMDPRGRSVPRQIGRFPGHVNDPGTPFFGPHRAARLRDRGHAPGVAYLPIRLVRPYRGEASLHASADARGARLPGPDRPAALGGGGHGPAPDGAALSDPGRGPHRELRLGSGIRAHRFGVPRRTSAVTREQMNAPGTLPTSIPRRRGPMRARDVFEASITVKQTLRVYFPTGPPAKKAKSAASNSSGRSNMGTCAAFSRTSNQESGISSRSRSPTAGGIKGSLCPQTSSVGTSIRRRSSRTSSASRSLAARQRVAGPVRRASRTRTGRKLGFAWRAAPSSGPRCPTMERPVGTPAGATRTRRRTAAGRRAARRRQM